MAAPKKVDATKDPEFQKVVQHFPKTPPKPHKSMKKTGEENEADESVRGYWCIDPERENATKVRNTTAPAIIGAFVG